MAKKFNLQRVIKNFAAQCAEITLITLSEGSYDGGKYVSGVTTETTITGAIVPVSDSKIYQSGGVITAKDRELYTTEPISDSLTGAKVVYNNNEYSIETERNFNDYDNAYIYTLKWVKQLSD